MAKRRKEDALETRERILKAAIEVFHQRGVAHPSLSEVAGLAGVTRGAIYGHFRNKADLFNALTERVQLPGETLCTDRDNTGYSPLGEFRARWLLLFSAITNNREWRLIFEIILLRCEMLTESGEIHQRLMQGHHEGSGRIRLFIAKAMENGELPLDLDLDVVVPMLQGCLIGLLQNWLMDPSAFDLGKVGERQIDALLASLHTASSLRKTAN